MGTKYSTTVHHYHHVRYRSKKHESQQLLDQMCQLQTEQEQEEARFRQEYAQALHNNLAQVNEASTSWLRTFGVWVPTNKLALQSQAKTRMGELLKSHECRRAELQRRKRAMDAEVRSKVGKLRQELAEYKAALVQQRTRLESAHEGFNQQLQSSQAWIEEERSRRQRQTAMDAAQAEMDRLFPRLETDEDLLLHFAAVHTAEREFSQIESFSLTVMRVSRGVSFSAVYASPIEGLGLVGKCSAFS